MPGIATGVPGAKAFDEVLEQKANIGVRNRNGGKPPEPQFRIEPPDPDEFRSDVLSALGVGKLITRQS